jgi:Toprim domain
MIGLLRDLITDEPRCIQRTQLTADGKKIDRQMLGPAKGAAIKIDPDADVTQGLNIGEGLETTLSGRVMGFIPAWALGSAGAIAKFPVLPGISALRIFGERDESGANKKACLECADRWRGAGTMDIGIVWPIHGDDLNDELGVAP